MKAKDLARLLNGLPDKYDNANVYVTMVKNEENNTTFEDCVLYCDVIEFTVDIEDDVIVIKGEL